MADIENRHAKPFGVCRLLSDLGGFRAMHKLQFRSGIADKHESRVRTAEERVHVMFDQVVKEARQGFRIALGMDLSIFAVGILLLVASASWALLNDDLGSWVGAGASGGAGVLGILYTTLVAKPRKQVKASVDHLMYVKVLFLGYLRSLHQIDQVFSRRLLEDREVNGEEMQGFQNQLENVMSHTTDRLHSMFQATELTGNSIRHQLAPDSPSPTTITNGPEGRRRNQILPENVGDSSDASIQRDGADLRSNASRRGGLRHLSFFGSTSIDSSGARMNTREPASL